MLGWIITRIIQCVFAATALWFLTSTTDYAFYLYLDLLILVFVVIVQLVWDFFDLCCNIHAMILNIDRQHLLRFIGFTDWVLSLFTIVAASVRAGERLTYSDLANYCDSLQLRGAHCNSRCQASLYLAAISGSLGIASALVIMYRLTATAAASP